MLGMIAIALAGFAAGVVLTSVVAGYFIGLTRSEAARIVDDHALAFAFMGQKLSEKVPRSPSPAGPAAGALTSWPFDRHTSREGAAPTRSHGPISSN